MKKQVSQQITKLHLKWKFLQSKSKMRLKLPKSKLKVRAKSSKKPSILKTNPKLIAKPKKKSKSSMTMKSNTLSTKTAQVLVNKEMRTKQTRLADQF